MLVKLLPNWGRYKQVFVEKVAVKDSDDIWYCVHGVDDKHQDSYTFIDYGDVLLDV
jgi:hypothetical protein